MPRRTPPTRLADIAEAARKVFTAKGYRRTLMTDVGKELGLSHALLYRFVESKEALFQLALLGAVAPERLAELPTPLPTPAPGEALRPLADWTAGNTSFPRVKAALATDGCTDIRGEFHGVVDEYYSAVEDNRALLALLERSAADLPELAELYFGKARRGQVDLLEEYVERRSLSGHLRPFPDAVLATQFIVETVAWFAWHRRDHPVPITTDDGTVRASVHVLLAAACIPDEVRHDDGPATGSAE
jgi:AcrR family transcriptional regulator